LEERRWCSLNPDGASTLVGGAGVPWWIAGGWAIDLFTGTRSRVHSDLDVGCFRQDLGRLLDLFGGWDVRVAKDGALLPLPTGRPPDSTANTLWLKPAGRECWVLEILIEKRMGADWLYRRDERIKRTADEIFMRNHEDIPYLRPEIQLLYKSKVARPEDEQDFRSAWPLLTPEAKRWLRASLSLVSPEHHWLREGEAG
jgi:hypothetical protein